jgi:poly-gamma-glutamate synthesis protein (capsule biosynthesis protein)
VVVVDVVVGATGVVTVLVTVLVSVLASEVLGDAAEPDEQAVNSTPSRIAASALTSRTVGVWIEQFGDGGRQTAGGQEVLHVAVFTPFAIERVADLRDRDGVVQHRHDLIPDHVDLIACCTVEHHVGNGNDRIPRCVREAVGMLHRLPAASARRSPLATMLLLGTTIVAGACSSADRAAPTAIAAANSDEPAVTTAEVTATTTTMAPRLASTSVPDSIVTTPSTVARRAPTTTVEPEPVWPRTVSLALSGDTLPHSPLWRQAERNAAAAGKTGHDFDPMLAGLAPVLATVDLAVCHLETPIAPEGEGFTTMPRYGVPEEVADAIVAAGYDRCSTASNHTADRGTAGIDRTVDVLESSGLGQSGMARSPDEIRPQVFDIDGVAVSHLSYTWSYNGLSLPEGEQWRSAIIDPERIISDATEARALGADVVIASMHWGAEGIHQPTGFQRNVADEITAGGLIDLVIGHHAHVLQPIEQVNGTWVLFGLGNILSNLPTTSRWPAASQDAAVVTVDVTVDESGAVTVDRPIVHPTWVDKDAGWTAVLVEAELARDDISAGQRGRLERSLERTHSILGEFFPAPAAP